MNIQKAILAVCMATAVSTAHAQLNRVNKRFDYNDRKVENGRYPLIQRIGLGYGVHSMFNRADFRYRTVANQQFARGGMLRGSGSMAASIDVYFPVKRFSERSCFAINLGVNYISTTLTHDTVLLGPDAYQKDYAASFIGVPFGIDYKTGGDAVQNKSYRTMFSAGVGIMPTYVQSDGLTTEGPANDDAQMRLLSYAKVEGGFFAGIAFKLRAMAYFGDVITANSLVTDKKGTPERTVGYREVSARGSLGYTISLIVMPGSIGWQRR